MDWLQVPNQSFLISFHMSCALFCKATSADDDAFGTGFQTRFVVQPRCSLPPVPNRICLQLGDSERG